MESLASYCTYSISTVVAQYFFLLHYTSMKQAFLKDMAPELMYSMGVLVEWPGFHMGHTHKGLSFISPSF